MLRFSLRVVLLTLVMFMASLVFAEEIILTTLILLTIALSVVAIIMGQASPAESGNAVDLAELNAAD